MSSSIFCYYHMIWRLDINWWCERILSFQEEVKKGYLLTLAWYTNYGLWYSLKEISWLLPQLGGRFKSVTLRVSLETVCDLYPPPSPLPAYILLLFFSLSLELSSLNTNFDAYCKFPWPTALMPSRILGIVHCNGLFACCSPHEPESAWQQSHFSFTFVTWSPEYP